MSESRRPSDDPKNQARQVCRALKQAYPEATCALVHSSPYQLLVATILSAQCTDSRVNMVTPELFRRFPDPASLALAEPPLRWNPSSVRPVSFAPRPETCWPWPAKWSSSMTDRSLAIWTH